MRPALQHLIPALVFSGLAHALLIAAHIPGPRYFGTGGAASSAAPLTVHLSRLGSSADAIDTPALATTQTSSSLQSQQHAAVPERSTEAVPTSDLSAEGKGNEYLAGGSLLHPDPYVPADELDSHPEFLTPPPEFLPGSSFFTSGRLFALLRIDESGHLNNVEVEYSDFDEPAIAEIIERIRISRFRPGMLKGKAVPSRWRLVFDVSLMQSNYKILSIDGDSTPTASSSESSADNH